jgi:hypothetical protein
MTGRLAALTTRPKRRQGARAWTPCTASVWGAPYAARFFSALAISAGGHDHGAATRDDEAVARQLVERARDGLAARADHVGQLLLGRAPAHHQALGALRALLAAQPDQAMDEALVDVAQGQLGDGLVGAAQATRHLRQEVHGGARVRLHVAVQVVARQRQQHGGLERHAIGRPHRLIEHRHLAERIVRTQQRQRDLAAALAGDDDLDAAAHDDEHRVARLVLGDHAGAGRDPPHRHPRGEVFDGRDRQLREQRRAGDGGADARRILERGRRARHAGERRGHGGRAGDAKRHEGTPGQVPTTGFLEPHRKSCADVTSRAPNRQRRNFRNGFALGYSRECDERSTLSCTPVARMSWLSRLWVGAVVLL